MSPYPKLTPLRAFALLETLSDPSTTADWKVRHARDALSNHVKAALVANRRRGRKRERKSQ